MDTTPSSSGPTSHAPGSGKVLSGPDRFVPQNSDEAKDLYGEEYYGNYCGAIPYEQSDFWLKSFGDLADKLIAYVQPGRVLDAGCAMGYLVESLRDRGVDAYGIDLSAYALSKVRNDIRPYCREGLLTEHLGGPYDLVTCIEVLEHLPPSEEEAALRRLVEAADTILFSSTPEGADHPTHYNVRPMRHWLERFAALGFLPDPGFDASFLAYQAFLLRRRPATDKDLVDAFADLLELRKQRQAFHASLAAALEQQQLPRLDDLLTLAGVAGSSEAVAGSAPGTSASADGSTLPARPDLEARIALLEAELRVMRDSPGWRLITSYRRWLRDVVRANPVIARTYEPIANLLVHGWKRSGARTTPLPVKTAVAASVLAEATIGGDLILHCGYPPADQRLRVSDQFIVDGWAVARRGIERVEVHSGDGQVFLSEFGFPTPELGSSHQDYPDAGEGGFRCMLDANSLPGGKQTLRIVAHARDGSTRTVKRQVLVDHRPAYVIYQEREAKRPTVPFLPQGEDPLISIITPLYRTTPELLRQCVASVQRQTYAQWELCMADDGSEDPALLTLIDELAGQDDRIRVQALPRNQGIAAATNAAIGMSSGKYLAFLDHDDELAPFALEEVVRRLRRPAPPDVLYSDEDKINTEGKRVDPYFKPGFSIELLRTHNYLCHFLVIKRSLVDAVGGIREGFDGSQDHDLALRIAEQSSAIERIPHVLYHWRAVAGSTAANSDWKPDASEKGRRAVEEHLARIRVAGTVHAVRPGRYRVEYALESEPPVLIIVPAGGNLKYLRNCVVSVLERTDYRNLRLLVADNSNGDGVLKLLREFPDPRIERMDLREEAFNFSRICNLAAQGAAEPLILFLNDDISTSESGWLREMVGVAAQPDVGAVGARLLYPDGRIQHGGVVLGLGNLAGHAFRLLPGDKPQYFGLDRSTRDCSAVTGACLLTKRSLFEEIGGFDEAEFPVNLQDVDYCLRVHERGYRVVCVAEAELTHYESATRKRISATAREVAVFRQRWQKWMDDDPYYNPNLTRATEDYSIDIGA